MAPVDLRLGGVGKKVESDKKLTGDQVAASELRAQPPLLDQTLHESSALPLATY
jgi:hypothetical protein